VEFLFTGKQKFQIVFLEFCAAAAGPGNSPHTAQRELRLIQSKTDIETPKIIVEAVPLKLGTEP
jgi:hypothetical protein